MRVLLLLVVLLAAGCDAPPDRSDRPRSADSFAPMAWRGVDGTGSAR